MKWVIINLFLLFPIVSFAQLTQTDPGLTAAVWQQTGQLHSIYKRRSKLEEKIIVAEGAITGSLNAIHNIEDKLVNYLSQAQGIMTNLYQIKRAGELVTIEIPNNIKELGKAIPKNLKGTAITALVSKTTKEVYVDIASLSRFVSTLVKSGSYTTNGENEKDKVNLLNSAERYYIANEIVSKLEDINLNLYFLAWKIRTISWMDLWRELDPESWYAYMDGENRVKSISDDWVALALK